MLFDVVLNHPGYATMADMASFLPDAGILAGNWQTWSPSGDLNWHSWNSLFMNYRSQGWASWWGPDWVRADFPDHVPGGSDDLTGQLAFLPDFRTESTSAVSLPAFFANKADTRAEEVPGATIRDYLVAWHTDWVRRFGIDGFRVDTAKHVELATWTELKTAAVEALNDWKAAKPEDALDDLDFWMVGEGFPPVANRDAYFPAGFDAMINFGFQSGGAQTISRFDDIEALYASLAAQVNGPGERNELTFASNHDTSLFFETTGKDFAAQTKLGTVLMAMPGAIQIFYGDESGREASASGSDPKQGTRSDMNWSQLDEPERAALLAHWQKLGKFRSRHVAVGGGEHRVLSYGGAGYAFARTRTTGGVDDAVVILMTR
ncbi:MAG: hypothetical protein HC927_10725 [Deltaproteobacteria bacterium]|nr:hypothetical protein [Deltaproteobacteria bacterium]